MPNAIPLQDWLGVVDSEYLSSFIEGGGTSVKFAVIDDELRPRLRQALASQSAGQGYVFTVLDAAKVRAHMPQDLFFEIARQVDWRGLARRFILSQAPQLGYNVDGIAPDGQGNIYRSVASIANVEPEVVLQGLRPIIQSEIFKNPQMVKDFRVAMTQLCQREYSDDDGHYGGQPLIEWLTGENLRITPVKPFFVYTPINRTTARNFLESAIFWFRLAGYTGTVIFFDNSRITLSQRPGDGSRYYTRAMVMDHYELLREFIDESHRLTGAFMVVSPDNDFLNEELGRGSRGYGIYEALMTRVMADVRDRNLANPMASLVQLSE